MLYWKITDPRYEDLDFCKLGSFDKFLSKLRTLCKVSNLRFRYRQRSASLQPLSFQSSTQLRLYTADAIPAVALEGEEKQYAPKIKQLVKDISQLNLLEVADLNELLKVRNWFSVLF